MSPRRRIPSMLVLCLMVAFELALVVVSRRRQIASRTYGNAVFAMPIGRLRNPLDHPEIEQRPSASLGALESVRVQLEALGRNSEPFLDHGVLTMYSFCAGAGMLELHAYFGYEKDLYHEEHFVGKFKSTYGELIDHRGYVIESAQEQQDESGRGSYWVVRVSVTPPNKDEPVQVVFVVDNGRRGVYLTERLVPAK
mmetsp:Transcript_97631/g.209482  ORF Transcript_97631/g.209482 Transcript_97631/m.209482 type:complete len:196 (+) Transcript_97631:75-662(+)